MARLARTNHANRGFKDNTPGAWVDTNGPVWWYGSDKAYLGSQPAGRTAITRATNLIVNRVSSVPWTTSAGTAPKWLIDPCRVRRDGDNYQAAFHQRMPRSVFWGAWIRSALSYGMGYLLYRRADYDGTPVAGTLTVLDPLTVHFDDHNAARVIDFDWRRRVAVSGDGYAGDGYWMLELRNPTTPVDPSTGATPGTLAWHAAELGLIDDQLIYAAGMYGGSGVPSGYLKVNTPRFTQAAADKLLKAWNQAHGSQRSTAILSSSTEYQPIAMSPVDTALADMKRLSLQDVANAYGVPGYMIGAPGTSMTYSNVEMEKESFYEFTLMPWTVAVEETLSALLPGAAAVQITPAGERGTDAGTAGTDIRTAGTDDETGSDLPPG